MSYEYSNIRGNDVAKSRVGHITKGYAAGGAVTADAPVNRKSGGRTSKSLQLKMDGGVAKPRMDRPGRARGGRSPKSKGSNVNVIIAPQGGAPGLPSAAGAGPGPIPMPPKPPMPMPMAGPPGGGPPMPPPGMPHAAGGRAYASGGAVKGTFEEGRRNGTQVQPSSGHNDAKDMNRKRVVTYATGGPVFASATGQHGPKFGGGAMGGKAKMQKAARAAKTYAKA